MIKSYANFTFASRTDKGRVRDNNEDNIGFFKTENGYLCVLCDGMGGHASGAQASEIAVNSIREYFESNVYDDMLQALADAIKYANNQIFDEAKDNAEFFGMGTTCIICLVQDTKLYYAHVGDSRVYLLSDNAMKQLTKDHTHVQKLIDNGEITREEAIAHPRKN